MILLEGTGCVSVNTPILQIKVGITLLFVISLFLLDVPKPGGSFFFFFSQLFPTVQGLENLGGQRLGRVEVRLLVRSAINWSWPHHRQTAAARWGCPSGHAALKAATPGWLSASGLWESGWEMARQLAVTLTLMDLVSPAFPPTPPTREMGLWP